MKVLVVEDEPKMAALLKRGLREEGLLADVVTTGQEAVWAAESTAYDVITLDIMLPDTSGIEVCRQLRAHHLPVPILILTARDAVPDRIAGLDAGADDYLIKPFAFGELLARLRALDRRGSTVRPTELVVGNLRLDPAGHRVWRDDQEIVLTAQEFAVLQAFMRRPGQVLTREQLLEQAWDFAYESRSNIVDVYVRCLREKLDRPFRSSSLRTVRGVGYRLEADGR